jgi:hypothetical protein
VEGDVGGDGLAYDLAERDLSLPPLPGEMTSQILDLLVLGEGDGDAILDAVFAAHGSTSTA